MKLKKNIVKAFKKLKLNFNINEIFKEDKKKFGVINTPALIIDNKIINQGSVLDERKIANILKQKLELN